MYSYLKHARTLVLHGLGYSICKATYHVNMCAVVCARLWIRCTAGFSQSTCKVTDAGFLLSPLPAFMEYVDVLQHIPVGNRTRVTF